jgi:hypothetical protein
MATLAELTEQNASIEQQMQEWRKERFARGENPMDWLAFRAHAILIGAPDPGVSPPDEFLRWDESMHGGESRTEMRSAPQDTVSPDAQPHSFGKSISEVNSAQTGGASTTDDSATMPREAAAGSKTSNWSSEQSQPRGGGGAAVSPENVPSEGR